MLRLRCYQIYDPYWEGEIDERKIQGHRKADHSSG